ncbi:lymphocyte activation gene 3 protein [Odontesthes bonariensis]|uniref:lymphocyte activation gene 3 protein n=1 Tax=Odontesthes bonariensis TaxID=219752 RepID=UPI003F58F4A6
MLLEGIIFGLFTFLVTARCETAEVLVEAGSQVVLPCKCSFRLCNPAAIIWNKNNKGTVWRKQRSGLQYWGSSWSQKDNQRVQCPHSQFDRGDYSLQISGVTEEDGGLYTCRIEYGNHVAVNQVMLRIIKVWASPSDAIWGNKVSVSCTLTPWPKEASVQWMLNDKMFVPSTGVITNGVGSVVIERATERMTGNWTCVLNHKNERRASATLTVRGIIQPPKDDTKLYAALGSAFALPCVFSPGLRPIKTVWEKLENENPRTLKNDRPSLITAGNSFRIQEVVLDSQGKYRCAGTIRGQRLTRTMQLVVAQIVQTKKKDSVMLTCQVSDASAVTEYEWVRVTYDLNGTESVEPVQKGQTVVLNNNWGEWTCRYNGKDGILGNVTYQVPMMSGHSGQKSGFSSNKGTVIGLSFLLVILLLILAQMYKNHQRRKRIFQYPALETIVHTISNEREERERNRGKD